MLVGMMMRLKVEVPTMSPRYLGLYTTFTGLRRVRANGPRLSSGALGTPPNVSDEALKQVAVYPRSA